MLHFYHADERIDEDEDEDVKSSLHPKEKQSIASGQQINFVAANAI